MGKGPARDEPSLPEMSAEQHTDMDHYIDLFNYERKHKSVYPIHVHKYTYIYIYIYIYGHVYFVLHVPYHEGGIILDPIE